MDTTAGIAPANLSFAGWSLGWLGHVVMENKTAAQVTRHEKTSLTSVLSDRG